MRTPRAGSDVTIDDAERGEPPRRVVAGSQLEAAPLLEGLWGYRILPTTATI